MHRRHVECVLSVGARFFLLLLNSEIIQRREDNHCKGRPAMKFSIEKGEFQRGLGRIQAIVEKRNTMPILANALLEVSGKKDGLTRARGHRSRGRNPQLAPVRGREAGPTHRLRAQALRDRARAPRREVHLEASSNAYLDAALRAREFTLAGTTAEEYPSLPNFAPESLIDRPGRRALRDDRAHDVRRLDRRDPVQPERRLRRADRRDRQAAHGRHRRPSPRATSIARSATALDVARDAA